MVNPERMSPEEEAFEASVARAKTWRSLEDEWDCAYMQSYCDCLESGLTPEEAPEKVEGRLTGNPYATLVLMP